jgi:anti-sigma factor ChrR (cupin superfamily)
MTHDRLDRATAERVSTWVFGSMTAGEQSSFEAHLEACAVCRNEALTLRKALAGFETLVPPVDPPEEMRARLLERIRRTPRNAAGDAAVRQPVQVWKQWAADSKSAEDGFFVQRADETGWEATGVDGVEVRKLFVDAANDRASMLVRMAPGTSYPSHRHANVEECLVLEGVLNVGTLRLNPGDYQRAAGGSAHVVQSTDTGCTLFIVSSLHDELLPSSAV